MVSKSLIKITFREQDEEANVGFVGNQDLPRFQAQGCKIGTIHVRTITCPEQVFPSAKQQATQQRGMQGIVAFIADQQISRKRTIAQVFSRYFDKVSILGLLLHLILQKTSNKLAAD